MTVPAGDDSAPDEAFANPRLAALYDHLDDDRRDLDHYVAIVEELGARSVLDVGCGTGTLACRLAARGLTVTGIDPAEASLAVARGKPSADRVRWILGDATAAPPVAADLATMTGNVAQVFVADRDWLDALAGIHRSLRPSGHLVFETRDPARRAWEGWTRDRTWRRVPIAGVGDVETWIDLIDVSPPLVSFRHTYRFLADGTVLTSDSTLRFRDREEVEASLVDSGFEVEDVGDAPDRPGLEFVFLARRRDRPTG